MENWYYEEESGLILCHKEGEDCPTEIAEVLGSKANARLIAKSPQMIELLQRLVNDGWSASISMEAGEIVSELEGK